MSRTTHHINIRRYYGMHVPAAMFLVAGGIILYGWPAAASIGVVLLSTLATLAVWGRIGARGRQICRPYCLWMALLLALALPPHLLAPAAAGETEGTVWSTAAWAILPAAGILLVILVWLLNSLGSGRVHPVAAAYLVLVILFEPMLTPHYVLKPEYVLMGKLYESEEIDPAVPRTAPWIYRRQFNDAAKESLRSSDSAAAALGAYTSGRASPDRFSISFQMVLRDRLPPLEDLIIGGEPGPIGAGCGLAILAGGLILLYRGLIDWRIPVLTVLAALVAFLILPIPVVITDMGTEWRWLAFRPRMLDWPAALTLANYELFASPLLFVAFFLATSPQSRPMSRGGRALYGMALGLLAAPAQLYGSVTVGPYVALLLITLASPKLDRLFRPRPLV